jgi:ABC-type antimicrobial peptide transport system permease subunit
VATILGVALGTAILVGALVVGDSVKYSLQQIVVERLGKTDAVVTAGERLFTRQLAGNIGANSDLTACAILRANGIAIVDGGRVRANQLQVWGIDSLFAPFSKAPEQFDIAGDEALINENLASLMGIQTGDELLLRVNKLNVFPSNTPFVPADETSVSFRVKIKGILGTAETGNFNLQKIQSAPRNVFVNIKWLTKQLGLNDKANVILLSGNTAKNDIGTKLKNSWTTDDLNLKIRENKELSYSEIISERVFVGEELEKFCLQGISGAEPVFSYFVNRFTLREKETPYSFVSSLSEGLHGNEMVISEWLANDLNAQPGDTIRINYFEVGPLRRLVERDTSFIVSRIVPMKGEWADVYRMPEIPGLSDAGHCRDWEAGVPIDLNKVRATDEEYWNRHKGTPKAYISLETARKLWGNRFGNATAIRFPFQEKELLAQQILSVLQADKMGFELRQVKEDGIYAASNGVDFGGLFIGLSFFVLAAAVLLTVLVFKLFLGFRKGETGTLTALGFGAGQVQKIFIAEALALIVAGILIGIPFGIVYNKLVLQAISSIWSDIVRTSIVHVHIRAASVLLGAFSIFSLSFLLLILITRNVLKQEIAGLQKQTFRRQGPSRKIGKKAGIILVAASFLMILGGGLNKGEINPKLFFISGFGLLPGLILLLDDLFFRIGKRDAGFGFSLKSFLLKRIAGNRKQNTMIVSFLSIGIFLVVSTGVNRKDLARNAGLNSSGTGGYSLFAKTTIPVPEDLNDPRIAAQYGFEAGVEFAQFRLKPGDDASCLNLNRISRPHLIGFNPEMLNRRQSFTFVARTGDLDTASPWLSLNQPTADGYIPAIADQTVIRWGLFKNVGDTLVYLNEDGEKLALQLIGGLANSVFQGNVLIAENYFIDHYPSVSGSSLFLIDSEMESTALEAAVKSNLRNYGVDAAPAVHRLLEFYKVENTYLNIFLMLGALGLLIGTIGLGILIFRMVSERSREYAAMLAIGFRKKQVFRLVFAENLLIVGLALLAGLIPSVVSAIPSATTEIYQNLIWWPFVISLLVFASAVIWMIFSIRMVLRKNLVALLRNE